MPDIKIIKLKIRRGTNAQRQSIVLEQGELGYTTDTRRVFIGDGNTLGGSSIGCTAHAPTITSNARLNLVNAVKGDIVSDNSLLYQLTGSDVTQAASWVFIGPKVDESSITYTSNSVAIKDGGITGNKFATSAAASNGGLQAGTGGLSAKVDNSTLIITSTNTLSVNQIDQRHINTTAFDKGITGGLGTKISVNADSNYFGYNAGILTLSALPNSTVSGLTLSAASVQYTGSGLVINSDRIKTVLTDVDDSTIEKNVNGVISLKGIVAQGETVFDRITFNTYGQITNIRPSIVETLSCSQAGALAIFNGQIDQTTFSNQTLIPTISSNGSGSTATVTLTSAGYIVIETNYGDIAIPIARI
jgi:hypothetical protein